MIAVEKKKIKANILRQRLKGGMGCDPDAQTAKIMLQELPVRILIMPDRGVKAAKQQKWPFLRHRSILLDRADGGGTWRLGGLGRGGERIFVLPSKVGVCPNRSGRFPENIEFKTARRDG